MKKTTTTTQKTCQPNGEQQVSQACIVKTVGACMHNTVQFYSVQADSTGGGQLIGGA